MKTMTMKSIMPLLLVVLLAFVACQSKTGNGNNQTTKDPDYDQTIALVFTDSSNVTEWHNAPLAQDATSAISLSEGGANGDCGKKILLTNNGTRTTKVTISTVFPFTDSPWEMSREYTVEAGQAVHVANNRVCYGGKETPFVFKIEGATFNLDKKTASFLRRLTFRFNSATIS